MREFCKNCTPVVVLKQYATIINCSNAFLTIPEQRCSVCKNLVDSRQNVRVYKQIMLLIAKYNRKFDE